MSEWIKWSGGESPVPDGTLVDFVFNDGDCAFRIPANLKGDFLTHANTGDSCDGLFVTDSEGVIGVAYYRLSGELPLTAKPEKVRG